MKQLLLMGLLFAPVVGCQQASPTSSADSASSDSAVDANTEMVVLSVPGMN